MNYVIKSNIIKNCSTLEVHFTLVKTNAKKNINSMINDLAMGVELIYDKAGLMPSNQSTDKSQRQY
jgi:hypothetical protein